MSSYSKLPLWIFLGGVLGVIVVSSSSIVIPKIPTIYTTLLIFIGQLFTGIIIDYFRDGFISKGKIIGGLLILLGIIYNSNVDKKEMIV
ncbi:DMT family transporter [Clostridium lacusfryxellense]|uniref:DMT family transporter n=1 Tax=Clostridium lacusfryxellense TaxID=205328 RepID=UPI001C0B1295|nr:DMT family transporter [Clostridium lacusfryxellense]MBU3112444.1 DMT family transporter [Clostridium lacusfryxellense]